MRVILPACFLIFPNSPTQHQGHSGVGKSTIVKQVKATQKGQDDEQEKKAAVVALIKSLVAITLDISAELCNCFDDNEKSPEVSRPP